METKKITQFVDDNDIRYRKQSSNDGYQYIKCVKSNKSEFTRYEIESLIDKDLYESKLEEFKNSDKYCSVINKERTTFNIYDCAQLELNKIKIGSNYFYVAEIEYIIDSKVREIDLNYILENVGISNDEYYEFTNSKELTNKTLMKLNTKKKNDIISFSNYVNSLCENCFIKIQK
jgi:hypothetical protein